MKLRFVLLSISSCTNLHYLVVCKACSLHLKKNFMVGGCGIFVNDVKSGGLLGYLALRYLAMGPNC